MSQVSDAITDSRIPAAVFPDIPAETEMPLTPEELRSQSLKSGCGHKHIKADPSAWRPETGWTGEPKDFNVLLMTVYSVENSGVRYLSAALKRAGFNTTIIFLRDWVNNSLEMPSDQDIGLACDIIREKRINLIGLGFISSLLPIAQRLTEIFHRQFPGVPVCWGGIHATSSPEGALDYADYLCQGEGEASLIDLCTRIFNKRFTGDIPNIWARLDGKIYKNGLRPLIQNLDELPYPDVEDANKYYIEHGQVHNEEPWKRTAEYRIYFSRGCPYNCSYCYVSILRQKFNDKVQKFYRLRSVDHILGELNYIKSRFPRLARVKIDDDTAFAAPPAWVSEFCEKYPRTIGLPFECMLIPPMLKYDFLSRLKKAGLVRMQTGIESGSPEESLKMHNRTPGNDNILEFSRFNRRLSLNVVYDLIIDNPWASEEMKLETAKFMLQIERPYDVYFYSLNFFPGTVVTKRLLEEGQITPDEVEGKSNKAWKQFRVSMDWPRSPEDRFYLAVYCLVSKPFIPKSWISFMLEHREWFKKHWRLPFYFAWGCNLIKMVSVAFRYLKNGELTLFKIRQYGDLRKLISQ